MKRCFPIIAIFTFCISCSYRNQSETLWHLSNYDKYINIVDDYENDTYNIIFFKNKLYVCKYPYMHWMDKSPKKVYIMPVEERDFLEFTNSLNGCEIIDNGNKTVPPDTGIVHYSTDITEKEKIDVYCSKNDHYKILKYLEKIISPQYLVDVDQIEESFIRNKFNL